VEMHAPTHRLLIQIDLLQLSAALEIAFVGPCFRNKILLAILQARPGVLGIRYLEPF